MLQDTHQEHHLLLNEKGQPELVPYEQLKHIAGGSNEVRAFLFKRKGDYYVVYWHISGSSKLTLPLNSRNVKLFRDLNEKGTMLSSNKGQIVVPVDNRRYLRLSNITKEQLMEAFAHAKVIH